MRVSVLTFIFITCEYSIITGGDGNCGDAPNITNAQHVKNPSSKFYMKCTNGYVRQAGTSSLFKCVNNTWKNPLGLKCIPADPRINVLPKTQSPHSPHPPSSSITTTTKRYETTQQEKSTSTVAARKIVLATTPNASTAPRTSCQTSPRTTTMEKATVSTSMSSHSPSSHATTSPGVFRNESVTGINITAGITAGTVILVIIAGYAAVGILLLWRRSRTQAVFHLVEMQTESDMTLIRTDIDMSSRPSSPIQPPVTPFKDSPINTCTDAILSD